jgi:leader peptidase (prepilin peptidase) / N-methyltransferase
MSADGSYLRMDRALTRSVRRLGLDPKELAGWGLTALLVLGVAIASSRTGPPPLPLPIGLVLLTGWIVWEDMRQLTIPDAALVGMAALAVIDLVSVVTFRIDPVVSAGLFAIEGLLCGGSLFALRELYFRRRGHDGIGFGDVKLAAAGGLLCGIGGFSMALLAASLAGLAAAAVLVVRRGTDARRTPIAFGALLAPALCAAWVLGAGR